MASALSQVNTPPPAPNPIPDRSGNPAEGPMPTAPAAGPQAPQGPQQAPAPTHEQVVAGLRHFDAIRKETETLLKNPNIGKSDIKSAIIDGMTKLVAKRMLTPAEAVTELSNVPKEPLDQRKWVQQHHQNAMMAENAMVEHHRNSFVGSGNWDMEAAQQQAPSPDDHEAHMAGLMGHYGRG